MDQKLIFTNLVGEAIDDLFQDLNNPGAVVVTDINTAQFVLPILAADSKVVASAPVIKVKAGDSNKNLDELSSLWKQLADLEATRQTVVINLGGGVVSDMGGFAAATFKRGMRCINVPTTVLSAVDACVGGKTGINFNGIKNQIGTFTEPAAAIISTIFFNTLPQQQILSGYAEMLKHGLLDNAQILGQLLNYSPVYPAFDSKALLPLIETSVNYKASVVEADLTESGFRKVLNLGHTVGHAIEAFAYRHRTPVDHGYAVAWGLVVALVMSHLKLGFPTETVHQFADYVKKNYGVFDISCDDYPTLLNAMRQDKKNTTPGVMNFTLLEAVGQPKIDCASTPEDVTAALDIYRDLMGI